MKRTLANTPLACAELLEKLSTATEIGFDTESAGPLLRNRTWKNGKTFINEHLSTIIGFSVGFPAPTLEEVPDNWKKKDGQLRKGRALETETYYVPLRHNKKNATWTDAENILAGVMGCDLWWHNSKHDHKMLLLNSFPLPQKNTYDTFIASLLTDPQRESHGLKALAFDLLGRKSPEFDPTFYNLTGKDALEYACDDAGNTLELGQLLRPKLEEQGLWDWFKDTESPFALVLSEMERWGMRLNEKGLRRVSKACDRKMDEALKYWNDMFPEIDIGSAAQLQHLFEAGVWKPFKKTPGGAIAVDRDTMEHQLSIMTEGSDGHVAADLRLDYQGASKIATTYTLGFIEEAKQFPDNRIHPSYNQGGAGTGRLSSSNPNGQNIPVRSTLGKKVKENIIPAEGWAFLSADYSQIELRVLAHCCGGKLMQAYLNGEDVHQQTADLVGSSRDDGKTLNFAIVYGAGPWTLAKQLKTDKRQATAMQKKFLAAYPNIPRFMAACVKAADSRGAHPYIKTLTGRRIYVPDLLAQDYGTRNAGIRKAGNAPIQGGAFDIMKIGMCRVARETQGDDRIRCVNNLHDEVTYEVNVAAMKPGELDDLVALVKFNLEDAFKLRVPLIAEPKVGYTWAETK